MVVADIESHAEGMKEASSRRSVLSGEDDVVRRTENTTTELADDS